MAPCRIRQFFPDARFVVLLREPADRALSEISMNRRHCAEHKSWKKDGWPYCCVADFSPVVPKLRLALQTLAGLKDECVSSETAGKFS